MMLFALSICALLSRWECLQLASPTVRHLAARCISLPCTDLQIQSNRMSKF